jgi:hypothetical protein
MTWLPTSPMVQTLFVAVALPIGLLALAWPLIGLLKDVWQLPMATILRPRIASISTALVGLVLFTATGYALGLGHIAGRLIITAAFGARPALWLTRRIAWHFSDADLRQRAADIRNELATRLHEREVSAERPWPSFIFDVERSRRRTSYEPPPI